MENIRQVNRVIKKAKKECSKLVTPDLADLNNLKIVAYSDASFANFND